MAYQAPKQWAHGDIPVASDMNKYSNSLNEIYSLYAGKALVPSVPVLWLGHLGANSPSSYKYEIIHIYRWLIYVGEGNIYNATETESTALPNTAGSAGTNFFDLNGVSWLAYSDRYIIKGVTVAMEARDA